MPGVAGTLRGVGFFPTPEHRVIRPTPERLRLKLRLEIPPSPAPGGRSVVRSPGMRLAVRLQHKRPLSAAAAAGRTRC